MATTKKDISLVMDSETTENSASPGKPGQKHMTTSTNGQDAVKKRSKALRFERTFTKKGVSPYDTIEWEIRDAVITDEKGGIVFEQRNVEVPKNWSQMALLHRQPLRPHLHQGRPDQVAPRGQARR